MEISFQYHHLSFKKHLCMDTACNLLFSSINRSFRSIFIYFPLEWFFHHISFPLVSSYHPMSFSKWSERKRGEKWRRVTAGQLVWRNWGWGCHNRSCILIQNSGEEWLDLTHYPNAVIKAWGRFREQSREAVPSVLNTHTLTQTDKDMDRARQDRQDANGVRQ